MEATEKDELYRRMAVWYGKTDKSIPALKYDYFAQDWDALFDMLEEDQGHSMFHEHRRAWFLMIPASFTFWFAFDVLCTILRRDRTFIARTVTLPNTKAFHLVNFRAVWGIQADNHPGNFTNADVYFNEYGKIMWKRIFEKSPCSCHLP